MLRSISTRHIVHCCFICFDHGIHNHHVSSVIPLTRNSAFAIGISQICIIGICKSRGLCRSERNYSAEIRTDHDFIYERGARRLRSTTRTQLRSSKLNEETTQHLPRVITLLKEKRRDDKVLYSIPASALVTRQAYHDFGSSSYSRIA